jgi:hypothetical protein
LERAFRRGDDHSGWLDRRWDVPADTAIPNDVLERTGHPDPIASRLLISAADVLDGSEALDVLFRQQLTDLLATRLLATHTGSPTTFEPTLGGLSPKALRHAIERLRSDADADVSLAALASDAGLSHFHSVVPLREIPDFRHMPGCANDGSNRQWKCSATQMHRSCRLERRSAIRPRRRSLRRSSG